MKGFEGNKTLLPLVPEKSSFEGTRPILLHILDRLPPGPKALVVHHRKEAVMKATAHLGITYCEQKELDGTGGALLAARGFLEGLSGGHLIITMGDVPLVKRDTYEALSLELERKEFVVLGFSPESKKQYGILEMEGGQVTRITEWKYWKSYSAERQAALRICNSGIYAARTDTLLHYLPLLASRPHLIRKEIQGKEVDLKEYFITDLIQYLNEDGLEVGHLMARDETEVMGVDDVASLTKAQKIFRQFSRAE